MCILLVTQILLCLCVNNICCYSDKIFNFQLYYKVFSIQPLLLSTYFMIPSYFLSIGDYCFPLVALDKILSSDASAFCVSVLIKNIWFDSTCAPLVIRGKMPSFITVLERKIFSLSLSLSLSLFSFSFFFFLCPFSSLYPLGEGRERC